jgi:hypothetical protein
MQWNHANGVKGVARQHLNQPYVAGDINKQANYITSSGTKEDVEDGYISQFIAQYGTKEALKDIEMKNREHVSVCFDDIYAYYTVFKGLAFCQVDLNLVSCL